LQVLNLFLALLLNSFASDSLQKKEKETKQETSKFKAAFQRLKMILRIRKKSTVEPEEEGEGGETSKGMDNDNNNKPVSDRDHEVLGMGSFGEYKLYRN
jgi:hypothetical protein